MPLIHDADVPMSLGDHLEELRRRLVWPLISLAVLFMGAFAFETHLQELFVKPLEWAYNINPENAEKVGLHLPLKLKTHVIMEGVLASMMVSFYTAFFLAFPVFVYHVWRFIGVGLLPRERRLAFLFVPAGIMFFYAGTMVGYFIGLPAFYSFMIKWAANNPILEFDLQLNSYHHNFVMMTMMFGLIMDIPWLIMVVVRVGFVSVEQLLKHWKIAIFGCTAVAAVVAPPDALSMIIMMVPLFGLFFLGVGLSALMMRRHRRLSAKEDAEALARMAEEERAAHAAQVPREDPASDGVASPDVHPDPAQPQEDETSDTLPIEDPQPVSRSAITDDLVAHDEAPSSDDHLSSDVTEPAPPSSGQQPRLGMDESGSSGETRKDDDRG